jgi:hypothetical protein
VPAVFVGAGISCGDGAGRRRHRGRVYGVLSVPLPGVGFGAVFGVMGSIRAKCESCLAGPGPDRRPTAGDA